MEIVLPSAPSEPKVGQETPPELVEYINHVRNWTRQAETAIRQIADAIVELQSAG